MPLLPHKRRSIGSGSDIPLTNRGKVDFLSMRLGGGSESHLGGTLMKLLSCALAGVLLSSAAFAQTAVPIAPSTATLAPITNDNVLRVGTKVPLKLREELTTKEKRLRVGQHFNMEVAEAVLVNGQVVIPVGSPAVGEVTEVRNKGMWGKSGHLTAQILYVTINGRQVRLTGTFDDKGVTGTAGVVAAIAFVPVAGFFTTGTSAVIPVGAAVTGFIGEDIPVAFAAPVAATPMVVAPVATPVSLPVKAK